MKQGETTTLRRQMGRRLKDLRIAANKTDADVEAANLASRLNLWRIETGRVGIKAVSVRGLCWLYDVDQKITDFLAALAPRTADTAGWEDDPSDPLRSFYRQMKETASSIQIYQP